MRQIVQAIEKSLEAQMMLPPYLNWLQTVAPGFSLNGDQVSILHKPDDFYTTLLERCKSAKHRIALASLYLGTGPLEAELVEALHDRLSERGKELQVNILLDANRGSRGAKNSRTMLLPLLRSHPHCQVSLYHTPALRGLLRYMLPPRYNELVGLQHMKLYLFDNFVIISGANLSHDYFTNRQDRYIVISDCEPLANFYFDLVERVSSVSLELNSSDVLTPRSVHPYQGSKQQYENEGAKTISSYYSHAIDNCEKTHKPDHDTWLFPLIELPPFGIHQDSKVTKHILKSADAGSVLHLATGYFNLTDEYISIILKNSKAIYKLLMAHPSANGFLSARGLAGGIPSAYTALATAFLNSAQRMGQLNRLTIFEYQRPGWTYHGKGLWLTLPGQKTPHLTLIGSSNFGARSVHRDLETQIALVTFNETLRQKLHEEQQQLYQLGTPFTAEIAAQPDRKPPLWVKTVLSFFKNFF